MLGQTGQNAQLPRRGTHVASGCADRQTPQGRNGGEPIMMASVIQHAAVPLDGYMMVHHQRHHYDLIRTARSGAALAQHQACKAFGRCAATEVCVRVNKHSRRPGLEPGPITTSVHCLSKGSTPTPDRQAAAYGSRRKAGTTLLVCLLTSRHTKLRLSAARAADQSARPCAGGLAAALRHHARDDGGIVAIDLLQQPAPADWKIVMHLWRMQMQLVIVDDVDVGLEARRDQAAIREANG